MTVSGTSPPSLLPLLRRNADGVRSVVAEAARRAGRDPGEVLLVAATKTVEAGVVALLPSVGILDAGENRVQEAEPKVHALSDLGLRWHMIGRLQTNKVRRALDLFHRIQSVDRDSVMDALAGEGARRGRVVDCLVQVNLSNEPTKGGYGMAEAEDALRRIRSLPSLAATGLMAIPAPAASAEGSRAAFRALREFRDRVRLGPDDLRDLSMGMSGDFGVAVEEGATIVRVGTALFEGLPPSAFGRSTSGGSGAGGAA
jgi:pyridoxal phosphate enzyme (YggS family)